MSKVLQSCKSLFLFCSLGQLERKFVADEEQEVRFWASVVKGGVSL